MFWSQVMMMNVEMFDDDGVLYGDEDYSMLIMLM
jgi:hypothetical protein